TYPKRFLPPADGKYLLKPVEKILRNADVTFGNGEGTFFNGQGTPKHCKDSLNCFAFKSPEHYAEYLSNAGFDLINVANNHSGDFGPEARERTIRILKDRGIAAAGSLSTPFCIIKKQNRSIGLACFAPNSGTPYINNLSAARKTIQLLDSICDIVIVSMHAGAEGTKNQDVPRQNEIFLGEDRGDVYEFAHAMIDAGADVVFGHGPHVTRALDLYKDRFIIYSMGNFCTYGRFNLKGANGIAPIIKVYVDKDGKFLKGKIYAVKQRGNGGPVLDASGAVIGKLQYLTKKDFPEAPLVISGSGNITKKKKLGTTKTTQKGL
ncbi:MAG: CapA family protein, partial [Candidatus Dadabacteria bacterium]